MRPAGGAASAAEHLFPSNWREWRRLRAWHLKATGWSQRDIAEALGVTEAAVSRWMATADEGGPSALLRSPPPGRPRRLTDQDCCKLEELLAEGATAHGWSNNLWTAKRVAEVIQKHFHVEYHPGQVCRILKTRLNWTCQRPVHHHQGRNDAAIRKWVEKTFPCILAAVTARGGHLVFVDEAGFLLEPLVRRTYAPRGKTPVHRIGNPHARISAIGAITVNLARRAVGLQYGMLGDNSNYQGPTVVQFLRFARKRHSGPMTVVWDRIPIHECDEVMEYLSGERDVIAEQFPAHAPELNPADGIWRYIKYGRLANYTPSDLDVLRAKVTAELKKLSVRDGLLKSFIRYTKLPIRYSCGMQNDPRSRNRPSMRDVGGSFSP
jgi:transposase